MSTTKNEHIPIIDISQLVDSKNDKDGSETWKNIAKSLVDALSTIGFVYIVGHGIKQQKIDLVNNTGKTFFDLPTDVKEDYARSEFHGWTSFGKEHINPERPGDLKESFNLSVTTMKEELWPDKVVPDFSKVAKDFFSSCNDLAFIMLKLIGIGMELEDPDFFVKHYNPLTELSNTILRLAYYPALPPTTETLPDQIRCGEHTDYGFCTLLFQDSVGGLEVRGLDGQYIPATPIEGSVVFNVGDLTQRWTSDRLVATNHRVMIPEGTRSIERRSVIFFLHPDNDTVVECIDGSNKYEKTTALEFLKMRFSDIHS